MPRRRVTRSADFARKARDLYPSERSTTGRPSIADFERGPLRAAEAAFALSFESLPESIADVASIRFFVAASHPAFQPLTFTGVLLRTGEVELVSVIEEEDYWEQVGQDPAE